METELLQAIVDKLEEIRCGLIDVEEKIELVEMKLDNVGEVEAQPFPEKSLTSIFRWGGFLHTWPTGTPADKRLHETCLELEAEGYIYRHIDNPSQVTWRPKED